MNENAKPSTSDDDSGIEIPEYELIRPIGEGAFGRVWLARNRTTGRLLAVKLVPRRRSGTTDPAGREIMSLTRLEANLRHHPNLLTIHHVGKTADYLYYVMDLADDVSGGPATSDSDYRPASLESRLESGPLPPDQCERCAEQLLSGLASLHEAAMVHRDVKPSNCLFVDGRLKVADFGLLTEVGPQISRLGTHKYMPRDGRMDTRADVHAAGLVIYEMITGRPAESFPRLGELANDISRTPALCALMRLALAACQPEPSRRFQDARAMLDDFTTRSKPSPCEKRTGRPVAVALGGIAVTFVIAAVLLLPSEPERVPVNFITDGVWFEATIYLDGEPLLRLDGTPCTTPCTVDDLPARSHRVVLKQDGLPTRDLGQIDFSNVRQVVVGSE